MPTHRRELPRIPFNQPDPVEDRVSIAELARQAREDTSPDQQSITAMAALRDFQARDQDSPFFEVFSQVVSDKARGRLDSEFDISRALGLADPTVGDLTAFQSRAWDELGGMTEQQREEQRIVEGTTQTGFFGGGGAQLINEGQTVRQLFNLAVGDTEEVMAIEEEKNRRRTSGAGQIGAMISSIGSNLALTMGSGPTLTIMKGLSKKVVQRAALGYTMTAAGSLAGTEAFTTAKKAGFTDSGAYGEFALQAFTTGALAKILGLNGAAILAKPQGPAALRDVFTTFNKKAGGVLREGWSEALEEGTDEGLRYMREFGRINPNASIEDLLKSMMQGAAIGGAVGGTVRGAFEVPFLNGRTSITKDLRAKAQEALENKPDITYEDFLQQNTLRSILEEEIKVARDTAVGEIEAPLASTQVGVAEAPADPGRVNDTVDTQIIGNPNEDFDFVDDTPDVLTDFFEEFNDDPNAPGGTEITRIDARAPESLLDTIESRAEVGAGLREDRTPTVKIPSEQVAEPTRPSAVRKKGPGRLKSVEIAEQFAALEKAVQTVLQETEPEAVSVVTEPVTQEKPQTPVAPEPTVKAVEPVKSVEPEAVVDVGSKPAAKAVEPVKPVKPVTEKKPRTPVELTAQAKDRGIPLKGKSSEQVSKEIVSVDTIPRATQDTRKRGAKFFDVEKVPTEAFPTVGGTKAEPRQVTISVKGQAVPALIASDGSLDTPQTVAVLEDGTYTVISRTPKGQLVGKGSFKTVEDTQDILRAGAPPAKGPTPLTDEQVEVSRVAEASAIELAGEGAGGIQIENRGKKGNREVAGDSKVAAKENQERITLAVLDRATLTEDEILASETLALMAGIEEDPKSVTKAELETLSKKAGFKNAQEAIEVGRLFSKADYIKGRRRHELNELETKRAQAENPGPPPTPVNYEQLSLIAAVSLDIPVSTENPGAFAEPGVVDKVNVSEIGTRKGLSNLSHEAGHIMYYRAMDELAPTQAELEVWAQEVGEIALFTGEINESASANARIQEGSAEYFRLFIEGDRESLARIAPQFDKAFRAYLETTPRYNRAVEDLTSMVQNIDALEADRPLDYTIGRITAAKPETNATWGVAASRSMMDQGLIFRQLDEKFGIKRMGEGSLEGAFNVLLQYKGEADIVRAPLDALIRPMAPDQRVILEAYLMTQSFDGMLTSAFGFSIDELVSLAQRAGKTGANDINQWVETNFPVILANRYLPGINEEAPSTILKDTQGRPIQFTPQDLRTRAPRSRLAIQAILSGRTPFRFVGTVTEVLPDGTTQETPNKDFVGGHNILTLQGARNAVPKGIRQIGEEVFAFTRAMLDYRSGENGDLTAAEAQGFLEISGGNYIPLMRDISNLMQDTAPSTLNLFNEQHRIGSIKPVYHPLDVLQMQVDAMVRRKARTRAFNMLVRADNNISRANPKDHVISLIDPSVAERMTQGERNEKRIYRVRLNDVSIKEMNLRIQEDEKIRQKGTIGTDLVVLPKYGIDATEGGLGEVLWIQSLEPEIERALQNFATGANIDASVLGKILTVPADVLRVTAVAGSPTFAAMETVRTSLEVMANTKGGEPMLTSLKGFGNAMQAVFRGDSTAMKRAASFNAFPGSIVTDGSPLIVDASDYSGFLGAIAKGKDVYLHRLSGIDRGFRLGEFQAMEKKLKAERSAGANTLSDSEIGRLAGQAAADVVYNPRVIGEDLKTINRANPFTSSPLQELLRLKKMWKSNKGVFAARIVSLAVVPIALVAAARKLMWDPEDWEELNQVPEDEMDRWLFVPVPKDLRWLSSGAPWIKAPKPYGMIGILQTITDRLIRDNSDGLTVEAAQQMLGSLSPIGLDVRPQAIIPLYDAIMGVNTKYNRGLEPGRLQRADDIVAYSQGTSDSVVAISGWLDSLNQDIKGATGKALIPEILTRPIRLQKILEGYTSRMGRGALHYADMLTREWQGKGQRSARGVADFIPIYSNFVSGDKGFWTRDFVKFLNRWEKFGGTSATVTEASQKLWTGQISDQKFLTVLDRVLDMGGKRLIVDQAGRDYMKFLKGMRGLVDNIENTPGLSPFDKYDRIQAMMSGVNRDIRDWNATVDEL